MSTTEGRKPARVEARSQSLVVGGECDPGMDGPPAGGTERADRFAVFLRRLCETQAYAIAGDSSARMVMGEYGLARWCGVSPERALAQAESMVAYAGRGK